MSQQGSDLIPEMIDMHGQKGVYEEVNLHERYDTRPGQHAKNKAAHQETGHAAQSQQPKV